MEITEVRIKLVTNPNERLRAFCSITLNSDFVIRDLKIIEGVNGVFVAMPSRKLADRCPRCGCKNHLRAKFCNECGMHLKENRSPKDGQGRAKLHADIAHPINAACRERIQNAVVEAYNAEFERSKLPGYKPQSFDDFDDYDTEMPSEVTQAASEVTQVDERVAVPTASLNEASPQAPAHVH
jgi:stage V sporulation protein G